MKFLVLAALVAASSAAGLRASPDDFSNVSAWYSFEGKGDCIARAISDSTDELSETTNEILRILKKHSAFTEIVGEIEFVRDTFLEKLKLFEAEIQDVNILRLAQKVLDNIPDFMQLSLRTAGLTARFHLVPAKLATEETAKLAAEACEPLSKFGALAEDLATQIKECL